MDNTQVQRKRAPASHTHTHTHHHHHHPPTHHSPTNKPPQPTQQDIQRFSNCCFLRIFPAQNRFVCFVFLLKTHGKYKLCSRAPTTTAPQLRIFPWRKTGLCKWCLVNLCDTLLFTCATPRHTATHHNIPTHTHTQHTTPHNNNTIFLRKRGRDQNRRAKRVATSAGMTVRCRVFRDWQA